VTVHDLYSKRRARQLGNQPDVFRYDMIPQGLRTQIVHIWDDSLGVPYLNPTGEHLSLRVAEAFHFIAKTLRREYGAFKLTANATIDPNVPFHAVSDLKNWFQVEPNVDRVLDAIELSFKVIDVRTRRVDYIGRRDAAKIADAAIAELNTRFKENGVGYQFTDGEIIRVDSTFVHAEAVIPALDVLRAPEYRNAQEEFLSAHEHYRHCNYEEALVDCCKSFESTMKVICSKRNWPLDPNKSTASELVKVCLEKGLIPPYWENHFTGLRTMLTSGIPTARNRQGGHGAGTAANNEPPAELVSYVLHMTASTILFLADSEKRLP